MRILQGTRAVEAPPGWREALLRDGRPVVCDLGAGDGRYVYDSARADPARLYVAIDPDSDALSQYAYRASRKPARGGVENARFVIASLERLPPELAGVAQLVRVNFPWGSLLRGLLQPEPEALRRLASLLAPGGAFEIVASYDPEHDTSAFAGDPLPLLDAESTAALAKPYHAAGLDVQETRRLSQDEALAIPSNWSRRLLHARPRQVYLLRGVILSSAIS